jgi:hypothetical protein
VGAVLRVTRGGAVASTSGRIIRLKAYGLRRRALTA